MHRAPGDTAVKNITKPLNVVTYKDGSVIGTSTYTVNISQDTRPTYGYGQRVTIGGRQWIKPTAYTHYSREYNLGGQASIKYALSGGHIGRTVWDMAKVDGIDINYTVMDTFFLNNSRSAAQVKALNKIGGQAANLGEDLATYKQTVHLFGSKAAILKDALYAFKHRFLRKYLFQSARTIARNGDKVLAQLYLEYIYGLVPLVQDVYNIHQLMKDYASGVKPIIIHGHGSSTQGSTSQLQGRVSSTTGGWKADKTEQYTSRCDLYGQVDPSAVVFRIINQLGLLNPLSLAWEITPWSFIVDWFIPIGPLLNAYTAPVGLNFISGTTATKMKRSKSGEFHAGVPEGSYIEDIPTNFTILDEGYSRITHTTWPHPMPYLNLNPLSGDRWLKALALAIANLKR